MVAFSLILATVGRTDELDRLFNSFAVQTFRDFEVVVVDQNTDDRLLPHLEQAKSLGVVVRHLKQHPANLAAARNTGIAAAKGKWLGFPDDDCWYDSTVLEKLEARFASAEAPAGVIIRWMEQGEPPVVAPNLTWARSSKFRDVPVSSITLFFRRDLLEKIGGFDARFGVGQWFGAAEETDLILRALHSGALVIFEPTAEVHHAVAPKKLATSPQARLAARCRARGTGALYAKHALPMWVVARGLAAPVLRPLLKGALGAELAHGYAVMRGRLDGLLSWNRRQQ
jgi:glycosyltransferase involved in cell wall biosynthesis